MGLLAVGLKDQRFYERAIASTEYNVKLANLYRKHPSNHNKLLSNAVHQIGLTTISVINHFTSNARDERDRMKDYVDCPNGSKYTPLQAHAEMVYSFSLAMLAGLNAMRMEFKSIPTLIKSSLHGKMAHTAIKKCEFLLHHPNHVDWDDEPNIHGEKGPPGTGYNNVLANYRTAMLCSLAVLNMGIAYAPKVIVRVLQMVGITGYRMYGFNCMLLGTSLDTILKDNDLYEQFPNVFYPGAAAGVAGYYCGVNHYLGLGELSDEETDIIFKIHEWTAKRDPPDSLGVLMGNAFKEQLKGDFVSALNAYDEFIGAQSKIRQIHFPGIFQKIWLHCVRLEFEECFELSMILKTECHWSPTLCNFLCFCFGFTAYNNRIDMNREQFLNVPMNTPIPGSPIDPPKSLTLQRSNSANRRRSSSVTKYETHIKTQRQRRSSSVIITGITEDLIRRRLSSTTGNQSPDILNHDNDLFDSLQLTNLGYRIENKEKGEELLFHKPEDVEITKETLSQLLKSCIKGKKNFGGKIAFHEYLVSTKAKAYFDTIFQSKDNLNESNGIKSGQINGTDVSIETKSNSKWGKDIMLPFLDLMYVFNGFNLASRDSSNMTLELMIDFIDRHAEEIASDVMTELLGDENIASEAVPESPPSSANFLSPDCNKERKGSNVSIASMEVQARIKLSAISADRNHSNQIDKSVKQISFLDFYKGVCYNRMKNYSRAESCFQKVLQNENVLKNDPNYSYLVNLACFEMALLTRSILGYNEEEGKKQLKSWIKRSVSNRDSNVFHRLIDYRCNEILFELKVLKQRSSSVRRNSASSIGSNISKRIFNP